MSQVDAPPADPLYKVDELMQDIVAYFQHYFTKLPTEVQRLYYFRNGADLLTNLNLFVRDHVLDNFLRRNPECLELFRALYGARYPYLMRPNLKDDEASVTRDGAVLLEQTPWLPQVDPLAEAFRPAGGGGDQQDHANNNTTGPWVLDYSLHPGPDSASVVPASAVYNCVEAYNKFEPIQPDKNAKTSDSDKISLAELERAERMYYLMNVASLMPQISDQLLGRIEDMPDNLRELLKNPGPKREQMAYSVRRQLERGVITTDVEIQSGMELELEFECPPPEPEDVDMEEPDSNNNSNNNKIPPSVLVDMMAPRGISTIHDSELHPYKGWHIEGPRIQLTRAKNFLADGDIDRTVDWQRKFAELTEYFSYLHRIFKGQDWGVDLKKAVDMLRTHWIYERYHYGTPGLVVDFPKDIWPKQSKRLPRLPGPDIVLRAETDEQRDLTGPRRLLHTEVVNAHDQQYEMPDDILKVCYLQPYSEDAVKFWANGSSAKQSGQFNLAHCENKHFEECMSGGAAHTATFLMTQGRFTHSPEDIKTSKNGGKKATSESLEAFARFRGGKRAALQRCLNIFNNAENRKLCTPWRTLTLPDAPKAKHDAAKKPDAGIIFTSMMLRNPPAREARDPWAYTRAHQWYKREQLRWAQWVREHAIKDTYGHRLWSRSKEPVMEMPRNWAGPVLNDLMDIEMRKRYELLRRCQKIQQGLRRAARHAPRKFIKGLIEMMDAGLQGHARSGLGLSFGDHEFTSKKKVKLASIRPTEVAWLEYVCQPSRNRPLELQESLGKYGEAMLSRATELMFDISPMALFRDMRPRTMDDFLNELNLVCRGPVKRYRFTREDVLRLAPKLHALRVLKVYRAKDGELKFGRPDMEFHPEDLVSWPKPEADQEDEQYEYQYPEERTECETDEDIYDARDNDSVMSRETISTKVSVPPSVNDFYEYPRDIPRKKDVHSLREYIANPTRDEEDIAKMRNFFYCLAYRLGMSLEVLKKEHERGQKLLNNPERQQGNCDLVRMATRFWIDDVEKRPNDPAKNPLKKGHARETLIYPDVVNIVDPELYEKHKEKWTDGQWPADKDAAEIVRKNILLEAYENKTMLWPLPLPYQSYAEKYKVEDPLVVRERILKARNGNVSEKNKERKIKEPPTTATMRREPIWTFGHPSRKPAAHLFWDINNWPVHLQTKETQEKIRSRGPKRRQPDDENDNARRGQLKANGEAEQEAEYSIPFWKKAEEREKFIPGSDEFWLGDTPLQRKVFESEIRNRLESASRKRPWHERLATVFFGDSGDKPVSDADLVLPNPDPDMIPKSRPAKRQRTSGPSGEGGRDDHLLLPSGRNSTTVPLGQAQTIHVEAGTLDPRAPYPALIVQARMPGITYFIPETAAQGRPYIEYHRPSVRVSLANAQKSQVNEEDSEEESEEESEGDEKDKTYDEEDSVVVIVEDSEEESKGSDGTESEEDGKDDEQDSEEVTEEVSERGSEDASEETGEETDEEISEEGSNGDDETENEEGEEIAGKDSESEKEARFLLWAGT